jgi:hypothetical protein
MECMSTMLMKLEHQERRKAPFLAHQMSKWFYDTFTGTATKATCCGLFVREGLGIPDVSYRRIWWRRGFTGFGPPERNTACDFVLYCC